MASLNKVFLLGNLTRPPELRYTPSGTAVADLRLAVNRNYTTQSGEKIVFHTGWWGGYNSLFLRRLSDRSSIVVLSNRVNWSFCNIYNLLEMIGQPANRDGKVAEKKG